MKGGIYQILNKINGKRYIGSAISLQRRRNDHWRELKRKIHYNNYLQRAYNKHGEGTFVFEILEYVLNPEQLIKREQHYLDTLKPEYNISPTAGSALGVKQTEEHRRKTSEAGRGRKATPKACESNKKANTGSKNPSAKLIESDIKIILYLLATGKLLHQEIAIIAGVSKKAISHIARGHTWRHVKISADDLIGKHSWKIVK